MKTDNINLKTKTMNPSVSKFNHYYVKEIYFSLYMKAISYCDDKNLDYSIIEKTKKYKY